MRIEKVQPGDLSLDLLISLISREIGAIVVRDFLSDTGGLWQEVQTAKEFRFTGPNFCGLGPGSFALPGQSADYAATTDRVNGILREPRTVLETAFGTELMAPSIGGFTVGRPLTVRSYQPDFCAEPHQDSPECDGELTGMVGMSCSLVPPEEGGAIGVWNRHLDDPEYAAALATGAPVLDRSKIPTADHYFNPAAGELLLIDATRIHCIDPATKGSRVSMSGFLAIHSSSRKVFGWS